jgi:hypothetical protein
MAMASTAGPQADAWLSNVESAARGRPMNGGSELDPGRECQQDEQPAEQTTLYRPRDQGSPSVSFKDASVQAGEA